MDQDLGGPGGAARQHPRGDQAPACLFQRVVAALRGGAGVFGPGLFPQRLQHRRQGGGAPRRQVTGEPSRPGKGDIEPQASVVEPVIAGVIPVGVRTLVHLFGQACQVSQVRAASRRCGQDLVRVLA